MIKIYCVEDINDLKYVGSTNKKYLCKRLANHRWSKKMGKSCSSSKLNLSYCIIYSLEECSEDQRKERERYWINKIDCVNDLKLNGRDMEKRKKSMKEYREKNREKYNKYMKEYQKEYYKKKKLLLMFEA